MWFVLVWAYIKFSSVSALFTLTRSDLLPSDGSTIPHIDLPQTYPLERSGRRSSPICSSYRFPLKPVVPPSRRCWFTHAQCSPRLRPSLTGHTIRSSPERTRSRALPQISPVLQSRSRQPSPPFVTSVDPSLRFQSALPTLRTSSKNAPLRLPRSFSRELPLALCWDGREEEEH